MCVYHPRGFDAVAVSAMAAAGSGRHGGRGFLDTIPGVSMPLLLAPWPRPEAGESRSGGSGGVHRTGLGLARGRGFLGVFCWSGSVVRGGGGGKDGQSDGQGFQWRVPRRCPVPAFSFPRVFPPVPPCFHSFYLSLLSGILFDSSFLLTFPCFPPAFLSFFRPILSFFPRPFL